MLTTIFSRRGTCIEFVYPNSCINAGRTVVAKSSLRRALAISSPINHFARAAGEPDLASVLENFVPNPCRLSRLRVDMRDIGDMDRELLLDDPARLAHALPGVPLGDVNALYDDSRFGREHTQHLTGFTLITPGDDDDIVALLDPQLGHDHTPCARHSTSGASETIFMNRRARNSRVTGPKMRVPIGSP